MDPLEDPVAELVCALFDIAPEDIPPPPSWEPGTLLVRDEPRREPAVLVFERRISN